MHRVSNCFTCRAPWLIACIALLLTAGCASVSSSASKHEVRNPFYGEVLYQFYQQHYFTALSDLMTAQHFERLGPDAGDAELLRGGMLLSYGQHIEAGNIFEKLIKTGAAPAVRDRAWFYLAKIRYQRGYLVEAEEALLRIEGKLPGENEDERQILHALLLMNRQQYQQAADLLAGLRSKSDWVHYGRYNLGVALIKAGEMEKGAALLEQVGRTRMQGEELKSLRDKANVALGFTYLQGGWPELARTHLERVRLEGLMSNKALLGMGWAHAARDQQERALVDWNELQNRDPLDSAVQESLLAVPYALGKLGAHQKSLEKYEEAITVYTREMARLDSSITEIQAGKLSTLLLQRDTVEEMGWFWKLEQLPDVPETHYLAQLMAGHDFQEAFKNYRDLSFLSGRLEQWASDVASYQDMLATRRQGFRERLPTVLASKRVLDQGRLVLERDRYTRVLGTIDWDNDAEALANERERAQLAQLERIRRMMSRTPIDDENWQRYRLLRGLLRWNIETDYAARMSEVMKALQALNLALAETEMRRDTLSRAQQEMPASLDSFAGRIDALIPRIQAYQARTLELGRAQAGYIAELAVATLNAQRERLATYVTQARFAVAQIYDQSSSHGQVTP